MAASSRDMFDKWGRQCTVIVSLSSEEFQTLQFLWNKVADVISVKPKLRSSWYYLKIMLTHRLWPPSWTGLFFPGSLVHIQALHQHRPLTRPMKTKYTVITPVQNMRTPKYILQSKKKKNVSHCLVQEYCWYLGVMLDKQSTVMLLHFSGSQCTRNPGDARTCGEWSYQTFLQARERGELDELFYAHRWGLVKQFLV